jgi:hypothetical protein
MTIIRELTLEPDYSYTYVTTMVKLHRYVLCGGVAARYVQV